MKIKKSSWHYKLNAYWGEYEFTDKVEEGFMTLCPYFWLTVRNLVGCIISVGLLGLVTMFLVLFLANFLDYFLIGFTGDSWILSDDYRWDPLFVGIIFLAFMALLSDYLRHKGRFVPHYLKGILPKRKKRVGKGKESSLVYEYLKAKKEKFCPIVQLEEE